MQRRRGMLKLSGKNTESGPYSEKHLCTNGANRLSFEKAANLSG